jgi:4'-phosphopantetheinyl transferase superfamily
MDGAAVGCDLELVEPSSPGFVRDFLTDIEQGYVAAQSDFDARDAAANLLWSAKESALTSRHPVAVEDPSPLACALPRHSWLDRPLTGEAVSASRQP